MPLLPTALEYDTCWKVQHNLRVVMISQYSPGNTPDSFPTMQNQNLENQSEIRKPLKSLPELSNELYGSWLLYREVAEYTAVNLRRHRQVVHSSLHVHLPIHTSLVLGIPLGHRMKPASHSRGDSRQFPLGITCTSLALSES